MGRLKIFVFLLSIFTPFGLEASTDNCNHRFDLAAREQTSVQLEVEMIPDKDGLFTPFFMNFTEGGNRSLLPLLPARAQRLTGTYSKIGHANCTNAVLLWHSIEKTQRYLNLDIFRAQLNLHFRPLLPAEPAKMGDVIVVEAEGMFLHTAIFVSENIVWHKQGLAPKYPYTFDYAKTAFDERIQPSSNSTVQFFRLKP